VLKELLAEGISLAEIGRRVDRHESTVAYWVARHGLQASGRRRYAARGALRREDLERLVAAGATIAEIADRCDRSKAAVRHWLGRYGLRTAGASGRRTSELTREARELGLKEFSTDCPRHGKTVHVRDSRGYFRCRECRQEAVVRRRRRVKEILVAEAGGCCQLCGYRDCAAALEFHHLDPGAKEFGLAQGGMARSIERLRAEARKCVLLCSNCHAEVENGRSSLSEVAQLNNPG
jgi:transposase